jgi:TRAP-type mannitol/chloroaromatic compound transport system substrate-binding protein
MKVSSKIGIFALCVALFLACGFMNPETSEAADTVYKWRAVTHSLSGKEDYKIIQEFCEMVNKASNGRLVIEPFGAGVLFPVFDSFDAIKNGIVELSMCSTGYWTGKDPMFAAFATRPGCPIRSYHEVMYLDRAAYPVMKELYAKHGLTLLGTFDACTPEPLMLAKKPIQSIQDFKGMNIRTSGMGTQFYQALGASAVSLSGPEIYTALQLGTIDAAERTNWQENMEMGFHEVVKYALDPAVHIGATSSKFLTVNPKKWEALPEDLKTIVLLAMDHARYQSALKMHSSDEFYKRKWIESGVEVVSLPAEDFKEMQKVGMKVYKEYVEKAPNGQAYLEIYARVLHELGYEEEARFYGYGQ